MSYTDDAIAAAVALSVQHIPDRNLPDKALDLLDEAGSRARIAAYAARAAQPSAQHADRHLELSQARFPSSCMHACRCRFRRSVPSHARARDRCAIAVCAFECCRRRCMHVCRCHFREHVRGCLRGCCSDRCPRMERRQSSGGQCRC